MKGFWFVVFATLWTCMEHVVASAENEITTELRGSSNNSSSSTTTTESIIHANCVPAYSCFGGHGLRMHWIGWLGNCHEACVPNFLGGLKRKFHWECGPCRDGPTGPISELGTTAVKSQSGLNMAITRPSLSTTGDLLLLVLNRSDGFLPLQLTGWTTGPACFKTMDAQPNCHVVADCSMLDGDYCLEFGSNPTQTGLDLATAVFYRTVQPNEPTQYVFNLRCLPTGTSCQPAWAIMTAFRGANNADPIGESATTSMDGINESLFKSVSGNAGDKLMLSLAFDGGSSTGVSESDFRAPIGSRRLRSVIDINESGFLFAEDLESDGPTGIRITLGPGDMPNNDALLSFIIRKAV